MKHILTLSIVDCNPPAPQCWIEGMCNGDMILAEASSSSQACLQFCKDTAGCSWFTFIDNKNSINNNNIHNHQNYIYNNNPDNKNPASSCIIFHECLTLDESCSSCTSGEKRFKFFYWTKYSGDLNNA